MQFLALENKMDYSKPSIIEKNGKIFGIQGNYFQQVKKGKKSFMY